MMRTIATNPAARGLNDDVATIEIGGETLILTHDMMAEGVHWLPNADPADVAWKLVGVNLSDLGAKGAEPLGVMLGYMLGDDEWDQRFAEGLQDVLTHYDVPLLGGDTVGQTDGVGPRVVGMTALGRATHSAPPSRTGARAGDSLYVTGTLGDASAGFDCITSELTEPRSLITAFNRPLALICEGQKLAPLVNAMMDISDGLLLDARRMAEASGLAVDIQLSAIPLSADYISLRGGTLQSRIDAASWGDDYQLMFAAPAETVLPVTATMVGHFAEGSGISLHDGEAPVPLPASLGFEHR
jgi:thiamine-monophosphate kinase